jgi:hypothetical protein
MRTCVCALVLALAGAAWAQEHRDPESDAKPSAPPEKSDGAASEAKGEAGARLTDPIEILKRADAAARKVRRASYRAEFKALGGLENVYYSARGTVILAGASGQGIDRFRIDATVIPVGDPHGFDLTIGHDGRVHYVIDQTNKIVYSGSERASMGWSRSVLDNLGMKEFVVSGPFDAEMQAEKAELRGIVKVNDQDCYEVHLRFKDVPVEFGWFFSTQDFLPLRKEQYYTSADGQTGSLQLTISELTPIRKFEQDPFKLIVPEGFKQSDKPAP